MKHINLTNGLKAVVDDEDYDIVSGYKWYAAKIGKTHYARCVRVVGGKRKCISMHSLILPDKAGFQRDHIDGNGLNNCRGNLRYSSNAENNRNKNKRSDSQNKYKGVRQEKRWGSKWDARIKVDGKDIHLGRFPSEREAALAYNAAALEHFGQFAKLNEVSHD